MIRSPFPRAAALLILIAAAAPRLMAQSGSVLISEFATRGGAIGNAAGEFVELYNPGTTPVDLSGWKLQYRSAAGSSYSPIATLAVGSVIKARSYFLLVGPTWAGTPAGDAAWVGSGIADNGNLRLVNAADVEIDRVGYGTGNDPKVADAPNHGDAANDNSVERKASATSTPASMGAGGAEQFAGNSHNSNNNANDFIVRAGRDPQNAQSAPEPRSDDGSGSARTTRTAMRSGETGDVPIIYRRDPAYNVTAVRIAIPAGFTWSRTAADVDVDAQAVVTVVDDTVIAEGIAFTTDSVTVTLLNLTAPSVTNAYPFTVSSRGAAGTFMPLQTQPAVLVSGAPIPIFEARMNNASGTPLRLNQFVTVNGIVTASNQFGAPSYVEDATGGIAVYAFDFADKVTIGEEVTLTGKVTQFNGLTELTDVVIESQLPPGGVQPPKVVTIAELLADGANGIETYESGLVRINSVTVNTAAWSVTGSGTNYKLTDATGELDVRVDNNVDFANAPAPGGSFDIIGVVSQYVRTSPYIGGYQLMPRMAADIVATGPGIVSNPIETAITPTAVTLVWRTGKPAAPHVRYGLTDAMELGVVGDPTQSGVEQEVILGGLLPGTIYRVQPFSVAAGDTSFAQPLFICSASATSTGTINVYFNKTVESSLLPSFPAKGGVNLKNKLLDRIDAAQHSVDLALYSFSGSVGDDIASSLVSAQGRGVKIRAIFESDNAGSAAVRTLRNAGIPVIVDNFDPINAGAGLMHNKFAIIDARDRTSDLDDWVLTGSWNATDQGTDDDAQNVVEIQDQALAVSYTKEFEEMWGSATETPNSARSRFGVRKRADTPQRFVLGQRVWADLHFSPSDRTNAYILSTIRGASRSLYFAILTFTRDDLAQAMTAAHAAGKTVRGVMDNSSDQGSEFNYLRTGGIDVSLKKGLTGLLHHKYLVVDPEAGGMVVTGSHNWSNAAEFANNENTVGIHDPMIARQFVQEWYRRYLDAGGTGAVVLGVGHTPSAVAKFGLEAPWPNPVRTGIATVAFTVSQSSADIRLALVDVLGREVVVLAEGAVDPGRWRYQFDTGHLAAGVYRVLLSAAGQTDTQTITIIR